MARIRFSLLLAALASAAMMVGSPPGSASGVIKGEPNLHAAVAPTSKCAGHRRLSAEQLVLIHIGARTDDPAVVAQALGGGCRSRKAARA
jgi:hypothetical protein